MGREGGRGRPPKKVGSSMNKRPRNVLEPVKMKIITKSAKDANYRQSCINEIMFLGRVRISYFDLLLAKVSKRNDFIKFPTYQRMLGDHRCLV